MTLFFSTIFNFNQCLNVRTEIRFNIRNGHLTFRESGQGYDGLFFFNFCCQDI